MKEYALYLGDNILSHGTMPEIAAAMGMNLSYLRRLNMDKYKKEMAKKPYQNQRIIIEIEED